MKNVKLAKEILEDDGYFVENLWHVEDVMCKFECTEDEAQEVLYNVLTNEWIMEQIQVSIDDTGLDMELKPKKEFGR
tara:strand:- start:10205 stop:10435 length:231 start_codon:yes stop_codon:yes gene_type:complete